MQIIVRAAISGSHCGLTITPVLTLFCMYSPTISLFFLTRDIFLRISDTWSSLFIYWSFISGIFLQFHLTLAHIFKFTKIWSTLYLGARQTPRITLSIRFYSKFINGISYFKWQNTPKQKKHIQAKNINILLDSQS
jgi:hypothetical protein